MKVLNIIKKVIIGILAVLFFGFVIINTILLLNINKYGVTEFNDTSIIIIKNDISSDRYTKGDLVIVKKPHIEKLEIGTAVFVHKVQKVGEPYIDYGKVGQVHVDNNAISFENGSTYDMKFVAGVEDKLYHNIGTYVSLFQSKWGFLFIILVPSFLIFVYELYSIVVEVKYGKDE